MIAAVRDLDVKLPVVVRLEGTNVEEGRAALRGSGFSFATADTMDEAAARVVALAGG